MLSKKRGVSMKIATIEELKNKRSRDNGEPLVSLPDGILVRTSVAEKIVSIKEKLEERHPGMDIAVKDGYRTPEYQERYFLQEFLNQYEAKLSLDELIAKTHQFVALLSVAGHPTGGAVDVTLVFNGEEVDMGGKIADFTTPSLIPTYSSLANQEQARRRLLLHDLMLEEGFAPFYGEWWHFSYGDKEWAVFYNMVEAKYATIFV